MKYLKTTILVAALMSLASPASATTLSITGVKQSEAVTIEASLRQGTSLVLRDKNGITNDTCVNSVLEATTTTFTGAVVSGHVNTFDLSGCSHTTDTITDGLLSITWTSGQNGTVSSSGAEITVKSTVFGTSAICKTGSGTVIGTLTGASSGNALIDIKATTFDCGALGTSSWAGEYVVTTPHALGVAS